ncbi:MAG: YpmA family protein [Thermoanaerobacterales bacterium]|nr:YpmA family protein [Bacillota bacterium]MDI6906343.1 YpmA family protein [Thermoanaerobacterales bacterium]
MEEKAGKLELIATRSFAPYDEMYQVVDFLNKNLKNRGLIFGLTKAKDGRMAITVYET